MAALPTVDIDVLITTIRVQTALDLVPRLLGPKDTWVPWMRDNLASELVKHTANIIPGEVFTFFLYRPSSHHPLQATLTLSSLEASKMYFWSITVVP